MRIRKPFGIGRLLQLGGCLAVVCGLATSCINEDLSKCGRDYAVDYELKLSTSLQLALDEEFVTAEEQALAARLRDDLGNVLSDKARVMDLSFFKEQGGELEKHQRLTPNANEASVTVYMNRGNYYNVALAATDNKYEVAIDGASAYRSISLLQLAADTVDAYHSALYMGLERLALSNESGHYYVPLYMVNSVPVLVVNATGSTASLLAAYVRGTASGLHCADSVYVYDRSAVMRTERTDAGNLTAFHCVCFPSANTPEQRITRDGDLSQAEGSLWEMDAYTRTAEGKYVKNTLYIKEPLRAGAMLVVKVKLQNDGTLTTDNPEVGVSVELDWKPGGDFDVEM